MFKRLISLPKSQSIFLFGARATGKSTLSRETFSKETSIFYDLLDPAIETRFMRNPGSLKDEVLALPNHITHVIIDEIQKLPKLLDVVHLLIETTNKTFILTGSSARKLKQAGTNLLAGRAFVFHLYPFTYNEVGNSFDLSSTLSWGMLPKIFSSDTDRDKRLFLQAYTQTYLKEEIWAEHIIKKLAPFHLFLEVAAQCNTKIINFSKISRDVGVDDKTIKNYFSILEDTLVGYQLQPFHHSFRKRLSLKPKFYFFDIGVARALANLLTVTPTEGTSYFGELFEHFIILECKKLADYYQTDFRLSYLATKDGAEIDLVIERPGQQILLVEIKSSININAEDLTSMQRLIKDFGACEAICLSRDPNTKKIGDIQIFPWQKGLQHIFVEL